MPNFEETQHPGAGTLFVYSSSSTRGVSPAPRSAKRGQSPFTVSGVPTSWEEALAMKDEPVSVPSPDSLLRHGIAEYTFLPYAADGVLGRGKFSTVYKVSGADGQFHALKHTPLYPHHPLISARLLREPTLLAELPRHPCLIGVDGWVRTEGHFYLIEEYAMTHVPLPNHPLPLAPSRAAYILDQMVSCMRDALHQQGRVCHRDMKGDNVLVDVDTGDLIILDLGLATRFSMSEPKLTTCCGSPAFHSPEIVHALSRPPGEVTYYGPELDIWCIALTLLSLLLQVRFPLGPKHTSPYIMRERAMDRLQELDELYPPSNPWRVRSTSKASKLGRGGDASSMEGVDLEFETREWKRVRKAMNDFLEIDGVKRMEKFRQYQVGEQTRKKVEDWTAFEAERKFKSTTFIPGEIKYTLPIFFEEGQKGRDKEIRHITLRNPMGESDRRVKSYIKYLIRSAGILYHVLSTPDPPLFGDPLTPPPSASPTSESIILQIVVPLSETETLPPNPAPPIGWFPSIFSFRNKASTPPSSPSARSVSVPPGKGKPHSPGPVAGNAGGKKNDRVLRCYIKIEFEHGSASPTMNWDARRSSEVTFSSLRDGLGLTTNTPLHLVSSTSSTSTSTSITPTPSTATSTSTVHLGSSQTHFHPNPASQRSVSASRPVQPSRPHTRRAASVLPVPNINTGCIPNPAHTSVQNNNAPPTPLSRQVSRSHSPTDPNPPISRIPSRATSRASSVSRKHGPRPGGLLLSHNHHSFHQAFPTRQSSSESKIHIYLSDARAYSALVKALDKKPDTGMMGMYHAQGDPSMSPMTMRRSSLAPSVAEERDEGVVNGLEVPVVRETEEEEPERGRPRSKDDGSAIWPGQLKNGKGKPAAPQMSPAKSIAKLPLTKEEIFGTITRVDVHTNGETEDHGEEGDEREQKLGTTGERDQSRVRPRGLLDVLFGKSSTDVRAPRAASVPPVAFGKTLKQPL